MDQMATVQNSRTVVTEVTHGGKKQLFSVHTQLTVQGAELFSKKARTGSFHLSLVLPQVAHQPVGLRIGWAHFALLFGILFRSWSAQLSES